MLCRIVRVREVVTGSGLAKSTLYLRVHQGLWTKPISLGARASGWPDYEVNILNAARIAGKCNEEIRLLVQELEAKRKAPTLLTNIEVMAKEAC